MIQRDELHVMFSGLCQINLSLTHYSMIIFNAHDDCGEQEKKCEMSQNSNYKKYTKNNTTQM